MTKQAIEKAREDLNNIISKYAMQAYKRANPKPNPFKKRKLYTLPYEAVKAREFLDILDKQEISIEEETEIKAFLIPYRTFKIGYID